MTNQEIQKLSRKKEFMLVLSEFAYELGHADVGLHWQDIGLTATKIGMIKLRVEIEDAEYTRTIVEA